MKIALESYWECLDLPLGAAPAPIAPERLADPFSQLPAALELTAEQQSWLEADLYVPHSWSTMTAYQRAAAIRGPTAESHEKRRRRFVDLQAEAEQLGFRLPPDFVTLIETDEYVNRLRFACHWIQLPDFICPCPLDENYALVLFLCEAQGCDYTHLLLGPDGSHCVTRTGHWYGEHPRPPNATSTEEEKKIYHLTDSLAEFLCQSSDEIRENEIGCAKSCTELGDKSRDAGVPEEAVKYYKIALSYTPDSSTIRTRIANLE